MSAVLVTANPNKKEREEKYKTGRIVVLPCTKRVYEEPPDAVTHLNDLLAINETQDSLDKVSFIFLSGASLSFTFSFSAVGVPPQGILQVIF